MTLEVELPFAFVVTGIPISAQASAGSRAGWKRRVAEAARGGLPEGFWAISTEVAVKIVYVTPVGLSDPPDVDNMTKPILDALASIVWLDDRQVIDVRAVRIARERIVSVIDPPPAVAAALVADDPFVYIEVTAIGILDPFA